MTIGTKLQNLLDAFAIKVGGPSDPRYLTILNAIQSSSNLEGLFNEYADNGKLKKSSSHLVEPVYLSRTAPRSLSPQPL